MKLVGIISTAVLSLTLGVAAPAFAQEQHEQQEEQKDKPAAKENEKRAQPEKPVKQEERSAKPEERSAQEQRAQAKPAAQRGRIPDDRFKANFGREHSFRVSQGDYNNHRFQYGGYSFGFVGVWPSNWLYTQNVYVVEIDGVYYLCNASYPGVNLALSINL